jgi:methylase of polypeptide subunit release factors
MIKQEKNVFTPNATTKLLVDSTVKIIKKKSDVLDLGCGTGYVGISVAKKLKYKNNYYFSDISNKAINLCKKNAKKNKIIINAKAGTMYNPWQNKKFDLIIESISAIAKKVAKISPWYKNGIPCDCGEDGTDLVNNVLKETKKYLKKNGKLIFPIVTLSNKKKILKTAKKNFKNVKLLVSKDWPLPKSMYSKKKLLKALKKKGVIDYKTKYGLILYSSEIYLAY